MRNGNRSGKRLIFAVIGFGRLRGVQMSSGSARNESSWKTRFVGLLIIKMISAIKSELTNGNRTNTSVPFHQLPTAVFVLFAASLFLPRLIFFNSFWRLNHESHQHSRIAVRNIALATARTECANGTRNFTFFTSADADRFLLRSCPEPGHGSKPPKRCFGKQTGKISFLFFFKIRFSYNFLALIASSIGRTDWREKRVGTRAGSGFYRQRKVWRKNRELFARHSVDSRGTMKIGATPHRQLNAKLTLLVLGNCSRIPARNGNHLWRSYECERRKRKSLQGWKRQNPR